MLGKADKDALGAAFERNRYMFSYSATSPTARHHGRAARENVIDVIDGEHQCDVYLNVFAGAFFGSALIAVGASNSVS